MAHSRIQGDVSTKEGVNKIAEQIKEKENVVDSLINCAGVMKPWKEPIKDHNNSACPIQVWTKLIKADDVLKAISAVDECVILDSLPTVSGHTPPIGRC